MLAAVVFAVSLLQAQIGSRATLWLHVPMALLLMVGTCLVLAWAMLRRGPARRPR